MKDKPGNCSQPYAIPDSIDSRVRLSHQNYVEHNPQLSLHNKKHAQAGASTVPGRFSQEPNTPNHLAANGQTNDSRQNPAHQ
jgi:hypothetical protein